MLLHRMKVVSACAVVLFVLFCCACCAVGGGRDRVRHGEKDVYVSSDDFAKIRCGDPLDSILQGFGRSARHCMTAKGRQGEMRVYNLYLDTGSPDNGLSVFLVATDGRLAGMFYSSKGCFGEIVEGVTSGNVDEYSLSDAISRLPQTNEVYVAQEVESIRRRNSEEGGLKRSSVDWGLSVVMWALSPIFIYRQSQDREQNDAYLQILDGGRVSLGLEDREVHALLGEPSKVRKNGIGVTVEEYRGEEGYGFITNRERYSPVYVLYKNKKVVAVVSSGRMWEM